MKKLYTGLLISLMTCSLAAQSFTKIKGTPFEDQTYRGIAFADVDNDNDMDLLFGPQLYMNNGKGVFEAGNLIPDNAVDVFSLDFADVDNDNDPDLIMQWMAPDIGGLHDLHTTLFTNDGNGNFLESPNLQVVGTKCGSIDLADIDGDADQDLLITGFAYEGTELVPTTLLYVNDGSGTFTEVTDDNFPDLGYGTGTFADVDNDNDPDVLLCGYNGINSVSLLFMNDGSGVFTESTGNLFPGVGDCSNAFGDIDHDGDLDLLITGWSGTAGLCYTELYTNDGTGQFTQVTNTPFCTVGSSGSAFADIDNDNDLDVLITGMYLGETYTELYTNDGSGSFKSAIEMPFAGVGKSAIAFADTDNDGDKDLLITGYLDVINGEFTNPSTELYRNDLITAGIPEENPLFSSVAAYPNPNQGQVTMDLAGLSNVTINVYGVNGSRVYHQENINEPIYQFELNAEAGIYILELNTQNETQQFKLVKE